MAAPVALFRCDASPLIGAGHVMRCLALAEWLGEAGWRIGFAVGKETITTVPALAASGFRVCVLSDEDPEPEALREQASGRAELLVVDHYKRDVAFETSCRSFANKISCARRRDGSQSRLRCRRRCGCEQRGVLCRACARACTRAGRACLRADTPILRRSS